MVVQRCKKVREELHIVPGKRRSIYVGTYKRNWGIIQNSLSALVDQLWRARETNSSNLLALSALEHCRQDIRLNRKRPVGNLLAHPVEVVKVLNMDRQLVNLDVVRRVLGVCPSQDSVSGRVKNVLSIGARKIGSEWDVERVENGGIGGLRGSHGLTGLSGVLGMVEGIHGHIRTAHYEIGSHSFRPVTHICQLIHDEDRESCVVGVVVVVVQIVGGRRRSAKVEEAERKRTPGWRRAKEKRIQR